MKKTIFALLVLAATAICSSAQQPHNAAYPDDPAYHQLPEAERGETIRIENFRSEKYFPGTERDIWIYIPRQYTADRPACLLIGLDGILMGATTALDNMIRSGEVPAMIGVFISPGRIKDGDKVIRYNRSNEWDTMSESLALFIEEEILPLVETRKTSDGRQIRISRNANDRAIYGASSGGIAAFTAAWFRPDLYSRVYSGVGTFIAFRGGNEYPALVRKSEPKPIRIFLQDGRYDTWSPIFGDWFEQNQLMESALDFAGYEMTFKWDRGGHSITHGTKVFPDAMRWLWKGWPGEVRTGKTLNEYVQKIINPEKGWKAVASGLGKDASLTALPGGQTVLQDGTSATIFAGDSVRRQISLKKGERVVGAAADGSMLTSANVPVKNAVKALVGEGGSMYVTDSDGSIWHIEGGRKTFAGKVSGNPADIAIYPDWSIMAAGQGGTNWVSSLVCEGPSLKYGQDFYYLHSQGGKMQFDKDGLLYVATPSGVQICDQNGRVRVIMATPSARIDDIALSGTNIWIISKGTLYVREILHEGYVPCEKAVTPKSEGQG